MDFFSADNKDLHAKPEQLRRQKKALGVKFDSIDFDARTGKVGCWKTSLDRCTCADFWNTGKPCKHMYRLASVLKIFDLDADKIKNALRNTPRSLYGCELSINALPPKNFVAVDFEGANMFSDSVCQVGLVVVENKCVTERKSFLIRPPYKSFTATKIHGIKFADVKYKPSFKTLWPLLKKYFDGRTLAAYSLPNDLSYLFAMLERYKLPRPNFTAFDVQENARACLENFSAAEECRGFSLGDVAKNFSLEHKAHDALSDALVTAQIQIRLSKVFPQANTTLYYSTGAAIVTGFCAGKVSTAGVVDYCRRLSASKDPSDRAAYKNFLRQVRRAANVQKFSARIQTLERALQNAASS